MKYVPKVQTEFTMLKFIHEWMKLLGDMTIINRGIFLSLCVPVGHI